MRAAIAILGLLAGCGGDATKRTCTTTADCPKGEYCAAGRCGRDCQADEECGSYDLVCDEHGRCVPRGTGDGDADSDVDTDADADGGCAGLRDSCATDADCCEGRCLATPSGQACVDGEGCALEGADCFTDTDCCSGDCFTDGLCARVSGCASRGDACAQDSDCCSGSCGASGRCDSAAGCRPVGELCFSGLDCCSGICSPEVGAQSRCADGRGCSPAGELCGDGRAECCSDCVDERCERSAGDCRDAGELCFAAFDCCSGVCAFMDGAMRCCCI